MGQFSTRDIYLAASLLSYGERIADVNNADPQHQVFIFDGDTVSVSSLLIKDLYTESTLVFLSANAISVWCLYGVVSMRVHQEMKSFFGFLLLS